MYDKERFEEIVNIQIAVLEERIEMEFKELFPIWLKIMVYPKLDLQDTVKWNTQKMKQLLQDEIY